MRLFRRFGRDREPTTGQQDGLALDALRDSGADLGQAREIRHYLYFESEHAGREAAHHVAAAERAVEVRPSADGRAWLVLVTHEAIADAERMAALREELEAAAASHDGEYDGWEAAANP
jgi:hypothetical protein